MTIPFTMTPTSINVFIDGRMRTIDDTHMNFEAVKDELRVGYPDSTILRDLLDIPSFIARETHGKVQVSDGAVLFDGVEMHGVLVERMLAMINQGFDIRPMALFLQNLMENELGSAIDELYLFLEKSNLPITEDGQFLAFKKVDEQYKDYYTRTFDNSIGKLVEMNRADVNPDRNQTCSYGLHFCSYSYLPSYMGSSGHVMVVKINPADVVAIPSDYDNAKGRTFKYLVVSEVDQKEAEFAFPDPVNSDFTPDDWYDFDPGDDEEFDSSDVGMSQAPIEDEDDLCQPSVEDYVASLTPEQMEEVEDLGSEAGQEILNTIKSLKPTPDYRKEIEDTDLPSDWDDIFNDAPEPEIDLKTVLHNQLGRVPSEQELDIFTLYDGNISTGQLISMIENGEMDEQETTDSSGHSELRSDVRDFLTRARNDSGHDYDDEHNLGEGVWSENDAQRDRVQPTEGDYSHTQTVTVADEPAFSHDNSFFRYSEVASTVAHIGVAGAARFWNVQKVVVEDWMKIINSN